MTGMIVMIVGTAAHGTVATPVGAATGVGTVTPAGLRQLPWISPWQYHHSESDERR